MTNTKKYKRYSAEFKREALKRASEDGVTDKQICEELGISSRQLGRWRDETPRQPCRGLPRERGLVDRLIAHPTVRGEEPRRRE